MTSSTTSHTERQVTAAMALAYMLRAGVPEAEWRITQDGTLYGHVARVLDRDTRQAMRRYAAFLGGRLLAEDGGNGRVEWVRLSVTARYRGAPVTVWAHTRITPIAHDRNEQTEAR